MLTGGMGDLRSQQLSPAAAWMDPSQPGQKPRHAHPLSMSQVVVSGQQQHVFSGPAAIFRMPPPGMLYSYSSLENLIVTLQ